MPLRRFIARCIAALLVLAVAAGAEAQPSGAVDFASPDAIVDLGAALAPGTPESDDPGGTWFTLPVQNRGEAATARILTVADPPNAAFAIEPPTGRPVLIEAAAADSAVIIERAIAFGANAFRVSLPAGQTATLALHFDYASDVPLLLGWTEPALIAHNRQVAILSGLVSGLLAAALAFAAGAAVLTSRIFPRWATAFLACVLLAQLTATGVFDRGFLTLPSGPYALLALAIAFALAAAVRLVDYIAAFEAFHPGASRWRDAAAIALVVIGIAAYAGVPFAGFTARVAALAGAAAVAGYLAHCGRIGIAAARRLAPAATIFALVTAAASLNALGLFGTNLVAAQAIGGFSAAGALLVALATAIPAEHSIERLRELRSVHRNDDIQAAVTDEAMDQARELAAVAASHQGVFDLDLDSGLVSLSADAAGLVGFPGGGVELGRDAWLSKIDPEDRPVYEQALETYRHHPGMAFRVEFRVRGPGKRVVWCELRATMAGGGAEATRCLGLIADVTARKTLEATEGPSLRDSLTGLGNRTALHARLAEIGDLLPRSALVVVDLDRFKSVNDSLGRDGADAALAAFVERLEQRFKDELASGRLALFRVGGDMFAGLAVDAADLSAFGRGLIAVTASPFHIAGREVFLLASVGVASGEGAGNGEDLLARAELAMIEAKRAGGGRVSLYSGQFAEPPVRDPVALETELRHGLERGEIEIYYQPVVRLQNRQVAGFEALLRWRHPDQGLIEPIAFVPHAEASGLILPLGRFVLERAVRDLAQWQKLFPARPPLFVSVNVAWRQIADPDFIDEFGRLLASADIARRSLKLEVTEGAVMKGADRAEAALQRLKDLGVGLAVDDFGTGHSSLSHLHRFPFEAIKIDKSIVTEAQARAGSAILRSIVTLARELKLTVVAEGVETEADATRMKDIGCEYAQGFFFGVAVAAAEVPAFLAATRVG